MPSAKSPKRALPRSAPPPEFAINCFRKQEKHKHKQKQGSKPEDRSGFLGKILRSECRTGYLAWRWNGKRYEYLGHLGTWAEAWSALST